MDLFLKILGFICLLVGVLIAIAAFFFFKLRAGLRGLRDQIQGMGVEPGVTPARLHLAPAGPPVWDEAQAAVDAIAAFERLGMEKVGSYSVAEIPTLSMVAYLHASEQAYVVLSEHPGAGVWIDIFSSYEDGTSINYSTSKMAGHLDQRPGHGKVVMVGADAESVWRKFLAERPQRARHPVSAGQFVSVFEQEYADEMDWRNARGYTDDEVRRSLAATGDDDGVTDEQVAEVREQMNRTARGQLEEALLERFTDETTLRAAEWEAIRDRLVFIWDQKSAEELDDVFSEWLNERTYSRVFDTAKPTAQPSARADFARLNDMLPPRHRFRHVGQLTHPAQADVYAAPLDPEDEE